MAGKVMRWWRVKGVVGNGVMDDPGEGNKVVDDDWGRVMRRVMTTGWLTGLVDDGGMP